MAESSLSVGAPELRAEIGFFLGYGRTSTDWSTDQLAEINLIMQAGVRQVYYPPAVHESVVGYEWSFLRPTTTLSITSGTSDYDLPDDFGRLIGQFHFPSAEYERSIPLVSVGYILELRANSNLTGTPYYAAIRYKDSDGSGGQRQEVLFFPESDSDWTLRYSYEAYQGKLTDANPYPLGGMQLAELYTESCLAVAEQRENDEIGLHTKKLETLLLDAVARDRKRGPQTYGHMGSPDVTSSPEWRRGQRLHGGAYEITYNGSYI